MHFTRSVTVSPPSTASLAPSLRGDHAKLYLLQGASLLLSVFYEGNRPGRPWPDQIARARNYVLRPVHTYQVLCPGPDLPNCTSCLKLKTQLPPHSAFITSYNSCREPCTSVVLDLLHHHFALDSSSEFLLPLLPYHPPRLPWLAHIRT